MMKKISLWLNLLTEFWIALMFGHCRLSHMVLPLVLMDFDLPLPFIPLLPSLLALPCHFVPPFPLSFASFMHLTLSTILPATWPPPRSSLHPVDSVLMALRPWVNGIYPSHVLRPAYLCPPSLFDFRMPPQNISTASPGLYEIQRFLWQVVLGVSEGWL